MAEVSVADAAGAVWSMLTSTHLGLACDIGFAGLVIATAGAMSHAGCGAVDVLRLGIFRATNKVYLCPHAFVGEKGAMHGTGRGSNLTSRTWSAGAPRYGVAWHPGYAR